MNSRTTLALALAFAGSLAAPAVPAQFCNPAIRPSAPDSRYLVNAAKGTVLDRQTGLTWKRCDEGRSGTDCRTGSQATFNWGAALMQAASSNFAGYKDWRVPNIKELESLVEVACYYPAINENIFPNNPDYSRVWSSSPSPHDKFADYNSRYVSFYDGSSSSSPRNYGYKLAVRLVRGGQ